MTPLQLANLRTQKLEAEADVERLTYELRQARSQIAAERDMQIECALRRQSGMAPQAAFILTQLYVTRRTLTAATILDMLPTPDHARDRDLKMVSVVVHRLRAGIGVDKIDTLRGGGYAITLAGIGAVEAALRGAWIGVEEARSDTRWGNRMLNDAQVREIRASGTSSWALSKAYNINATSIARIRARETYKDVPDEM